MSIVLLTSDLMVASRVEGAAARAGVPLQSATSGEEAIGRYARNDAKILLVDLSSLSLEIAPLIEAARSLEQRTPTIIAFGPHVHKEKLAAARAAGCDKVLSRGQFFADLDAIVRIAARRV